MMSPHSTTLVSAIARALSLKDPACKSLSAITASADCTQELHTGIDELLRDLVDERWHETETMKEVERVLLNVDAWIDEGSELKLIWDEGCPHDGWYENTLPCALAELDRECIPLRRFQTALCDVVSLREAIKLAAQFAA